MGNSRGFYALHSFLHAFDCRKGHKMLTLMLDPWFKSLRLMFEYLGHEIIVLVVLKYNEKLLLPLFMEAHKLLMFNNIEIVEDLELQVNYKDLF